MWSSSWTLAWLQPNQSRVTLDVGPRSTYHQVCLSSEMSRGDTLLLVVLSVVVVVVGLSVSLFAVVSE